MTKHSPNWRDGAFRNVDEAPGLNRTLALLAWKLWGKRPRYPAAMAREVPRVEPNLALLATPGFEGITWLGHGAVLIQLAGTTFLTDPIWGNPSGYRCRVVRQAMPMAHLPPIDVVLISHDHRDHLDTPTLRKLSRDALYVAPLGLQGYLRRRRKKHILALDWWESHRVGGVKLTFVPTHHWSRRGAKSDQTLWGGWVLEARHATVYYSGDTAYMPVLKEIGRRFPSIDYAILSVGAYEPRWLMKSMHMSPAESVQTFLDVGARRLIPVHWGTLQLGDVAPAEPPARLKEEFARRGLPHDSLCILAIGETLPLR